MSSSENSPEPGTSSGARALTYSEVVQGISAPLDNDYWYRYQKQDFEEATRIALEASLKDVPLICKSDSEDSLDNTTPGFNHARGRGKKNDDHVKQEIWEDGEPGVPRLPSTSYPYQMSQKPIDVIEITDSPPKKKNKKASRFTVSSGATRGKDLSEVLDSDIDSDDQLNQPTFSMRRKSKAKTKAKRRLESDVESLSDSSSSSSQDDNKNKKKKKQRKISLGTWDNVERQSVGRLPVGIDSLTVYEIKGFVPDKIELLQDGRKWKKTCPTVWRGHARTRFADCKGSIKCTKEHCPFKMQFGVTNTTQFEKKRDGKQVCKGCGSEGEFVPCGARRYLSYGKNKVTVYHVGEHTCPVTSIQKKKDIKTVEQLVRDNPNIKPSEIQSTFVLSAFQREMDWDEVEKEAAASMDKKRISNIKQKVKRDIEPFGHNFEAVVSFKEYSDKRDLLYIYKVNDRRGNPDKPSFVFKTSSTKAKIALSMDKDRQDFMNNEFCFFDGKRKRCRGFITLTASVYHPLLRKQIPLAIMETEREDTTNVELFWTLFNEALGKVANDPSVKFNPVGWCSDMAGANLAGITRVYGNASLIKSCEFHFKDHRNKKARNLDPDSAEEFKGLSDRLLHSTTVEGYESAKRHMDEFVSAKEDRAFLVDWVSWWHDRRGFIFRAFAVRDAPQMNQAEVIHAGWVHRDRPNLSLLDACQADTRDSLLLDVELKNYQSGSASGGSGPSFADRQRRRHASQINKARSIGKEMFADDSEKHGLLIDPQSSHRPSGRKKSKRNPKKYLEKSETNTTPTLQQPDVVTPMAPQMSSAALQIPSQMLPQYTQPQGSPRILVSQLSAHLPFQTSLGIQQLQVTPSPPISHRIPMQVPPPVRPFGPAPAPSWNAGMSPNAYEIVVTPAKVQKCYGCGNEFSLMYKTPPTNIVIKHVDRRVTRRNEQTGQLVYSSDFSNTYYHPIPSHISRKNPIFTGLVYIDNTVYASLNQAQRDILNSLQFNIIMR